MKRILFAIGNKEPENFIASQLTDCDIVGSVNYREAVITKVKEYRPDILVLRETLKGTISIDEMIFQLRTQCEYCRIVLIAGNHTPGDRFLTTVISRGVYDIVWGSKIKLGKVIDYINKPSLYRDVAELQNIEIKDRLIEDNSPTDLVAVMNPGSKKHNHTYSTQAHCYTVDDYIPGTVSGAYSLQPKNNGELLNNDELLSYDVMPGFFRTPGSAALISFAGVRQGSGCTTVLINTAYGLANRGYRVLIVDAVFDCPYIFSLLSLPPLDCGMECVVSNYIQGNPGTVNYYSVTNETAQRQVYQCDRIRLSALTKGISYTMFCKTPSLDTVDYFDQAIYDASRFYDFILFDINLSAMNVFSNLILKISDRIITVNTGNSLELMVTESFVRYFDPYCRFRQKMISVINKSYKHSPYDAYTVGSYFNIGNVVEVPDDTPGFVSAQDDERFYLAKPKKPIKKAYETIIYYIERVRK